MNKRAIILAGGKGARLRPYTVVLPKPLMPIGEYPILEVVIRQLAFHKFTHVTLAVNHQAEIIRAFFGDGSKWGIKIDYSLEEKELSTMGPLKLITDLPDNFLLMNGDLLSNINFSQFYNYHISNQNLFTISAHERSEKIEYGVLKLNKKNKLCGFEEKPTINLKVSMGIYMINKKVLDYIPPGKAYGFNDLMLDLLKSKKNVDVKLFDGFWLDIGRPDDYLKAVEIFEQNGDIFIKGVNN